MLLGMFPYVMMATTPLFYAYDWPRSALSHVTRSKPRNNCTLTYSDTAVAAAAAAAAEDAANADEVDVNDHDISPSTTTANTAVKVCRQNDAR